VSGLSCAAFYLASGVSPLVAGALTAAVGFQLGACRIALRLPRCNDCRAHLALCPPPPHVACYVSGLQQSLAKVHTFTFSLWLIVLCSLWHLCPAGALF
jgi:hypothetical protein